MKKTFKLLFHEGACASTRILSAVLLATVFLTACQSKKDHGFRLVEKRFVKEINAECLLFEHVKSGARLMKIKTDDPNKTFSITFRTFPESDNGLPHIMEHSVLNGSKNFPVKSPFDVMSKGSLSTFMNAFTSKDYTMYPVASMNEKDYFNLMHVYLDAVFNPLLIADPRILKQEGWHYDLTDKKDPVKYNGIVYNEMKGVFSNPQDELSYQVYKTMFPDNSYGFESGGYPPAIPTLTQEAFINFHKKFYHPENSYIYLYGNADVDKELAFIDSAYLSNYTRTGSIPTVEDQKPFTEMKARTVSYPVMEGASTDKQTYLSMNWVAGPSNDPALTMALDVICDALVNQESAPIRLALQQAGIGQDVSAYSSSEKQNLVQIIVQNANPDDKQKFLDIVNATLKDVTVKGLDKKELEGIINRMEFRMREGDNAQKGLTYLWQSLRGWFFGDNPFSGLEYEKPLAEVKTSLTTNYLETIIRKYFMDNPHALLLSLEPKPGLDNERNAKVENDLKAYKATLNDASMDKLISESKELVEYQKREDKPEALATIPMLKASDINPKSTWYQAKEKAVAGIPVLHYETFTNNVIYVDYYFDMRVLPQELIPYAPLLSYLIGILNTENYTYGALSQVLNINTGGFYTELNTFAENEDDSKLIPKFTFTSKVMPDKLPKLFELSLEVLNKTKYTDKERLKTLLTRYQSQLDERMKGNGFSVASTRVPSYFSNRGVLNELTEGMDFYWFITNLTRNFDANAATITANLEKTANLLFTKNNLTFGVTCDEKQVEPVMKGIESMAGSMRAQNPVTNNWVFKPEKRNEGIMATSKVQYVVEGYNFKKIGYAWDGKMRVLSHILSTDYLQTSIRVIGGAYGGWSSFSPEGTMLFNSYRDPNLKGTLDNYYGSVDFLKNFKADEKDMTRYIIGTIAGIDQPLTPSQQGKRAVSYYFKKKSAEEIQKDRDAVLATKPEDIRGFAKLVQDVLDQNAYCVYGNADRLKSEKSLFGSLLTVGK